MATDRDSIKDYEERYEQGNMKIAEFREEARKDVNFFLNKQFSDQEQAYLKEQGRECLVNNKIRRGIMLISGFQRMNQLSSVAIPQGEENQELADIVSEALQWIYTKRDGYHHLSDCFLYGPLVSGINFSEIVLDYSQDPDVPDIIFDRIPYNAAVWDPYFSKPDMSDCAYFIRRRICSKNDVLNFLPQYAKEIKELTSFGGDGKFTDLPAYTNPTGQEMIAYNEYWEKDTEKRLIILDAKTNEFLGLIDKDYEKEAENYVAFDRNRKLVRRQISTVKLSIILNDQFIEKVSDPLGINEYPFVAFMGVYVPEHDDFRLRLQSVLRAARDPQSEMNRRISKFLDILDSKIHTGWIFKKKALYDNENPYQSGNSRSIAIKNDAVIGQDIAPIVPPPTDPSLIQALGIFDQNIMDTLGLNDATFGIPESGNDSGLLTMLRQQSSVVGLQALFDGFSRSQYFHARKVILTMQRRWPNWKWKRITGKDVSQFNIRDSTFMKFDAHVTQGILTENQQKMFFIQLVQLRQMGVNIPDNILLKFAPMQDKGTLVKEIRNIEQQQAQQQQQQQALMQQQIQLANQKTISEIKENEADRIRSNARAVADVGLASTHIAEASQKRAKAALDMTKAAQEIQSSEQAKLLDAIAFINELMDQKLDQNSQQLLFDKSIVDSFRESGNIQQQQGILEGVGNAIT